MQLNSVSPFVFKGVDSTSAPLWNIFVLLILLANPTGFALLLNPDGLQCEGFATHAWAEGVFEFCAKLRRGWPPQCNSMYICFLANPQNLKISDLLDVPIERSPFALALSSASHMLVVPNRFISIYTRLWCCYEAFVAYTSNKIITLPRADIFVNAVYARFLGCLLACFFASLATEYFFQALIFQRVRNDLQTIDAHVQRWGYEDAMKPLRVHASTLMYWILGCNSTCSFLHFLALRRPSPPSLSSSFSNLLASAVGGVNLNLSIHLNTIVSDPFAPAAVYFAYMWTLIMTFLFTACCVVHILKCRTEEARLEETYELQFKKLTEASCSDATDQRKILEALAGREAEVENAINTLMSQGMSTAELRAWDSGSSSSAYLDISYIVFSAAVWPAYILLLWLCSGSFNRLHLLGFSTVIVSYSAMWWTVVKADADLINTIARANLISWSISVLCGTATGCWGIAGGNVCATYYVADRRARVQQQEFHRFVACMLPLTGFSCGCVTWGCIAILINGDAFCAWQELIGVTVCSILWVGVAKAVCWYWVPEKVDRAASIINLLCSSANCLVVAANIATNMRNKFFDGDDTPFNAIIPHRAQSLFGIWSLVALGALSPLWLLWRRTRSLKPQIEVNVEMAFLNARDLQEMP